MSLIAAGLTSLLIESGPTLIRSLGNMFGGSGQQAANITADLVASVTGLSDKKAASAELGYQLSQLPPETIAELEGINVQLENIKVERDRIAMQTEKNQQDYDRGIHQQTQQTIRNGDQNGTDYVKETRPKIARLSTYAAIAYAFIFQLLTAFDKGDGVDVWILSALFSPALTYMGVRTVDAFSRFKTGRSM